MFSATPLPKKLRSKICLVFYNEDEPQIRYYLYFESETFAPHRHKWVEFSMHKKELTDLLLAGARTKAIKFREQNVPQASANQGFYQSKGKKKTTKWAVHYFLIAFFYTFFPKFTDVGNFVFRDDWDALLHKNFLHIPFPFGSLLNPPYLHFGTYETFLTLDLFVEHCLANLNASGQGFAAILPAYKNLKLKKNKSTFWANRKTLQKKHPWFLRLYNHPRVAIVLLDKRINFLKSELSKGRWRRSFKGSAPFHSVLVFFGFRQQHLLAQNTASSFINPLSWLSKLVPLQGNFQPKCFLQQSLLEKHTAWIQHVHEFSQKILPCDLSLMSSKAKQGLIDKDSLELWDWSPYLQKYKYGDPWTKWDGNKLLDPLLHKDLHILYDYRKKWAQSPLVEISYQQKLQMLADIEVANSNIPKEDTSKLFCDYCANFGHERKFCDWLPNERADWGPEHKKMFDFFHKKRMMPLPALGRNPSLIQLRKFMSSIYTAEKNFWAEFEEWSGISKDDFPFPTLCWGNLPHKIGALHQIGVSKRFLADFLTGADLQFKPDENGEPQKLDRVLIKNKFSKIERSELKKELEKGNKMRYLVPIPKMFVHSCENAFFKPSSGKIRFIQDLMLLCSKVRAPKFKLKDAIELFSLLHPLGFGCTADVSNAYRAMIIHPTAAASQCFHCEDDDGNDQFWLPRGMVFGNASNCEYCESCFKNIICRPLCRLSPSLFCCNYLDDFYFNMAIFEGVLNYIELLGCDLVQELVVALNLDFDALSFEFLYEPGNFPIVVDPINRQYVSERSAHQFRHNFDGEINGDMLQKLQTLEIQLATSYMNGVRDFVFEFVGYFLPLNNKSQTAPTRAFEHLGFIADLESGLMVPKAERITKLFNLLEPCFQTESISIEVVQTCLGMLTSLQLASPQVNQLKYLLSRYLSTIHKVLGYEEHTFPPAVISVKRPCPEVILSAFLDFLHCTENFAFRPVSCKSDKISLHTTHPNAHYWPKAQARNVITNFVDTSDYAVGSFLHHGDKLSFLETSHLPPEFLGSHKLNSAFKASSTTRELYGIKISLIRNIDFLASLDVDGLRICCDNKAALWMIFTKKAKKPVNQDLVNDIHQILHTKISYPVELHWLRRSKYAMQLADFGSKQVCHFSMHVTEFFNEALKNVLGLSKFRHMKRIPDEILDIRSPHQPLGKFLPKGENFVLAAPLNVAKAESLVDLCFLRKISCVLVLPMIFGGTYMDDLRKKFPFFFATYRQLYAGVPYLGFDAMVVWLKF